MQVYDWQAIVKDHGPAVWQTAYRLLGNRSDTADCFQETFLGALEISRAQSVRSMSGLLVRLATTRAIDKLRQRCRREKYQGIRQEASLAGQDEGDPSQHAETEELTLRLRVAIGQLPAQEAKAFCLRYFNEMSYREVARELEITTGTAGVLLHRAKTRLRATLEDERAEIDEVSP